MTGTFKHLLCVLLSAQSFFAIGQSTKEQVPDKFVGTVILAAKKSYVHYTLSQKQVTELTITGPGELTVYTRVRIGTDEQSSGSFHLKYILDGSTVSIKVIGGLKPSTKTSFKSKLEGVPTQAAKTVIRIPPGKHVLAFYKAKTSQPIHSRFLFKLFNKPAWKDIKPSSDLEKVGLTYSGGKTSRNYYRITSKEAFHFSINDTARLRILVRDEFTYKMLSENYLRLEVTEEGKEPKTYKFLTKRAKNVNYSSISKLVPSYLKSMYLDLPRPTTGQKFIIKLKEGWRSALLRISYDTNLTPIF